MFDWLSSLFEGQSFDRILDCYALRRVDLLPAIEEAIRVQRSNGSTVWMVAHFADQIFELQSHFFQTEVEHKILSEPVEPNQFAQISSREPDTVHLALAELLIPAQRQSVDRNLAPKISMIAIERHPLLQKDQALEKFARQIPSKTKFGYYLSLEDPTISPFVSETTLNVLQHLGMDHGGLIHCLAVAKAIDRGLRRVGPSFDPSVRADSAQEWLSIQTEWKKR